MAWKTEKYNWNRCWFKAGEPPSISDEGFTYVSNSESRFRLQQTWSLEELERIPCLVLLGEPGMGKTISVRSECERLGVQSNCILVDLGLISTRLELKSALIDTDQFSSWLKSEEATKLSIFFDSLDECMLPVNQVFSFIESELFPKCNERLGDCLLRVASRDYRWKISFAERLKALWGASNTETYELAPLTRADALLAARLHNIDSGLFNAQIKLHSLETFAATPLTLIAILRRLHETGSLPTDQWELFDLMMLQLCTERNDGLQSTGTFSPEQRRAIASRIAYLSMFSGRNVIDRDQVADVALCRSESEISISDLIGGSVNAHEEKLLVTKEGVNETLDTSLFTYSSEGRMTWSQKGYCEYLAAHYLHQNGFSMRQIANLFLLNDKCIPQLAETAVWLATRQPPLLEMLCRLDVPTMLTGDGRFQSDNVKRQIVDAVFKGFADGSHLELRPSNRQLGALMHDGLASQITSVLKKKNSSAVCKRFAIDLAEACNLTEAQNAICNIALSPSQDINVRREACHALAAIADDSTRAKMMQLCHVDHSYDPDNDLFGNALVACYPRVVPVKEMLEQLVPPTPGYLGMYAHFIGELPNLLTDEDLPAFLDWAASPQEDGLQNTIDDVIIRCLKSGLQSTLELSSFLGYFIARCEQDISPVSNPGTEYRKILWQNEDLRKRLLKAILRSKPQTTSLEDFCWWVLFSAKLCSDVDFRFVCEALDSEELASDTREVFIHLACRLADWGNISHWDLLLNLRIDFEPNLAYFCPIEKAPRSTVNNSKIVKHEDELVQNDKKAAYRSPREVEQDDLTEAESGNVDRWWNITHCLTFTESGARGLDEKELDITSSPGWLECTEPMRTRLLAVARSYLEQKILSRAEWFGKLEFNRPFLAVCKAFILLIKNGVPIPDSLQKKWVSELIACADRDSTKLVRNEVSICLQVIPSESAMAAIVLLEHDSIYSVEKVLSEILCANDYIWFVNEFIDRLFRGQDLMIKPGHISLLKSLQQKFPTQFSRGLKNIVASRPSTESDERKVAVAWSLLASASEHAEWVRLFKLIKKGGSLSKRILLELSRLDRTELLSKLDEDALRDLYLCIVCNFPRGKSIIDEVVIDDAEWAAVVYPEGSLSGIREQVFSEISQIRQNESSCRVLRELVQALPHYVGLPGIAESAILRYRSSLWTPLSVSDLKAFATRQESRIIQDENQLAECVLESLNRLQEKLQRDQNPAVLDLWNECGEHFVSEDDYTKSYHFTPKAEARISDYLVRFLRQDLIERKVILCREAEIRAGDLPGVRRKSKTGTRTGQVVDIYVAVAPHGSGNPIVVVVEVKGCWNNGLHSSMEGQLRERYMKNNAIRHGIYAVAYFHGEYWPSTRRKCGNHSLKQLQDRFKKQSLELSEQGYRLSAIVLDCGLKPS